MSEKTIQTLGEFIGDLLWLIFIIIAAINAAKGDTAVTIVWCTMALISVIRRMDGGNNCD